MKQTDLLKFAGIEMEKKIPPERTVTCEECQQDFPRSKTRSYPDACHEPGRRKKYMYLCRDCEQAMQEWVDENLPGMCERIEEEAAVAKSSLPRTGSCSAGNLTGNVQSVNKHD